MKNIDTIASPSPKAKLKAVDSGFANFESNGINPYVFLTRSHEQIDIFKTFLNTALFSPISFFIALKIQHDRIRQVANRTTIDGFHSYINFIVTYISINAHKSCG